MNVLEKETMQAILRMARSISDALTDLAAGIKEQNRHLEQIETLLAAIDPGEIGSSQKKE